MREGEDEKREGRSLVWVDAVKPSDRNSHHTVKHMTAHHIVSLTPQILL
jgi:hypothetical protein